MPKTDYFWELWATANNIPAINIPDYKNLEKFALNTKLVVIDHIEGFDKHLYNPIFDYLNQRSASTELWTEQLIDNSVQSLYPNIKFRFDADLQDLSYLRGDQNLKSLAPLKKPAIKGLVTCFNRGGHVGRQFLTACLYKMKLWDSNFCSKKSVDSRDRIDGNISQYFENIDQERFYRKFLIDESSEAEQFYSKEFNLTDKITDNRFENLLLGVDQFVSTFLTLVSETKPESYHPYVTEKFLFPVITKSLWLSYAQPGFHDRIEKCYGFKKYTKIFDYSFDVVQNPVIRLVELISMISKFKLLSLDELMDLYRLEQDTIEYNYDHYFSGNYLTHLKKFEY